MCCRHHRPDDNWGSRVDGGGTPFSSLLISEHRIGAATEQPHLHQATKEGLYIFQFHWQWILASSIERNFRFSTLACSIERIFCYSHEEVRYHTHRLQRGCRSQPTVEGEGDDEYLRIQLEEIAIITPPQPPHTPTPPPTATATPPCPPAPYPPPWITARGSWLSPRAPTLSASAPHRRGASPSSWPPSSEHRRSPWLARPQSGFGPPMTHLLHHAAAIDLQYSCSQRRQLPVARPIASWRWSWPSAATSRIGGVRNRRRRPARSHRSHTCEA
jgi:hypothetical protein